MPRASSSVDGRLSQHHRPVAAPGQHDRVTGDHRDGGDGRTVGREGLDATAGSQDAVPGGGDLQHRDERHREQQRAEHSGPLQPSTRRSERDEHTHGKQPVQSP